MLPYSLLPIYVIDLPAFAKWLARRTIQQREVIQHVNILCAMVLDGIRDEHELDFYTFQKKNYAWVRDVPNLRQLRVLLLPYQRSTSPSSSLPTPNSELWGSRAQVCADAVTYGICTSHHPRLEIVGEWQQPVTDARVKLAIERKIREDGFSWCEVLGRWVRDEGLCGCTRSGVVCRRCARAVVEEEVVESGEFVGEVRGGDDVVDVEV